MCSSSFPSASSSSMSASAPEDWALSWRCNCPLPAAPGFRSSTAFGFGFSFVDDLSLSLSLETDDTLNPVCILSLVILRLSSLSSSASFWWSSLWSSETFFLCPSIPFTYALCQFSVLDSSTSFLTWSTRLAIICEYRGCSPVLVYTPSGGGGAWSSSGSPADSINACIKNSFGSLAVAS